MVEKDRAKPQQKGSGSFFPRLEVDNCSRSQILLAARCLSIVLVCLCLGGADTVETASEGTSEDAVSVSESGPVVQGNSQEPNGDNTEITQEASGLPTTVEGEEERVSTDAVDQDASYYAREDLDAQMRPRPWLRLRRGKLHSMLEA